MYIFKYMILIKNKKANKFENKTVEIDTLNFIENKASIAYLGSNKNL